MAAHLLGLDSVSEYAGILQGDHVRMAEFISNSAILSEGLKRTSWPALRNRRCANVSARIAGTSLLSRSARTLTFLSVS